MKVELFSVLVDTQRLTAGLFKQFEQAKLWTPEGGRDTSLELIGVVRHKVGDRDHWVLARRGETLVRCALHLHRKPEADFQRELDECLKMAQRPQNSLSNYYKERAAATTIARDTEQSRFEAHSLAASLTQLFLGLR